jgi:hypothetical protein
MKINLKDVFGVCLTLDNHSQKAAATTTDDAIPCDTSLASSFFLPAPPHFQMYRHFCLHEFSHLLEICSPTCTFRSCYYSVKHFAFHFRRQTIATTTPLTNYF